MKIDQKLIDEFDKNGALCLRGIFDKEWVDLVRAGIEKNLAAPSQYSEKLKGNSDGHYFDDYCNWTKIEEFKKFALESPAAALVGALMKSKEVAFYHEHVLVKEPGTDRETPWHHDQSYYPIDGEQVCSIWMPVDAVPKATCCQFLAGSHKLGWFQPIKFETTLPYPLEDETDTDGKTYQPVPDIEGNREKYNLLCWDVEPGDCIVFHGKCLHGAPGNLSETCPRRVLSTRWLGDDAVIARRPWKVSPPTLGGLQFGDRATSTEFPIVWKSDI